MTNKVSPSQYGGPAEIPAYGQMRLIPKDEEAAIKIRALQKQEIWDGTAWIDYAVSASRQLKPIPQGSPQGQYGGGLSQGYTYAPY